MEDRIILQDKIMSISKTEIRIQYDEGKKLNTLTESKIGGRPTVPFDFNWPYFKLQGKDECEAEMIPLSFLAQINLSDIRLYDIEGLFPHHGILSFFYELDTMCWGNDLSDKGCSRVFYFPIEEELCSIEIPEDINAENIIPEIPIDFAPHMSVPDYEELETRGLFCNWHDYDRTLTDMGYEYDELGKRTKLIGYPDVIQSPMEVYCEILRRGYSFEEYEKLSDKEKAEIIADSSEWILLFQMGTVETDDFSLYFGDCGHIYFWIKKSDLDQKNFDNVWLFLQCG